MLHYAVVFFVIALIAAFFGFGGIAVGAAGIAKILFIVFLIGAASIRTMTSSAPGFGIEVVTSDSSNSPPFLASERSCRNER